MKLNTARTNDPGETELDITAFMNLMIVLVPVLLMSMVFARITVLEIKLPDATEKQLENPTDLDELSLRIRSDKLVLYYPVGVTVKEYLLNDKAKQNILALTEDLKSIKSRLASKGIDKNAITLMPDNNVSYQTIISVMDAVRSYEAVVAASVVDAELFPNISFFDDNPVADSSTAEVR